MYDNQHTLFFLKNELLFWAKKKKITTQSLSLLARSKYLQTVRREFYYEGQCFEDGHWVAFPQEYMGPLTGILMF